MPQIKIPRVKLGSQGLEVSRLGFGCAGLSGIYNSPLSHEAGCSVIKEAFYKGVTLFDTSDIYGANHDNEIMVGKFHGRKERKESSEGAPREEIQLATKFGLQVLEVGKVVIKGTPEYVRDCCEASLKRLGVDYIDLYYQHRVDIELGIGIVAYSPLGRGFFGGKAVVESLPTQSILTMHPRFTGENLEKNKLIYARLEKLAAKHGCTLPQLALAWLFHQGDDVVPIPGKLCSSFPSIFLSVCLPSSFYYFQNDFSSFHCPATNSNAEFYFIMLCRTTKVKNLDNNIGSLGVKLTEDDLKEICDAVPLDEVNGSRDLSFLFEYIGS
ncbi:Perakine reductase [Vitis vinifera]|uniref:Perakine reductase n=1 Tax=Vitis vinifera TaxID=29760 RepID=A0A438F6Y4_VITVI|nr:Perakine reductase [Vitis vinifera]